VLYINEYFSQVLFFESLVGKVKNAYLIILVTLVPKFCFSQSFEGRILYDITYLNKDSSMFNNQYEAQFMGSKKELLIKGGRYLILLNGFITSEYYDNVSNTFHYKSKGSDSVYSVSGYFNSDTILNYKRIRKTKEFILGNYCHKLIIETKESVITVFFNKKYKVDKSLYSRHNFRFWSFIIEKTGSIPLKTIVETKNLIISTTAVKVQSLNLEKNDLIE
jgi:hypothetical protein